MGLTGLATDILSVDQLLKFRTNLYKLRENRDITPEAFSALLSSILYEKRSSTLACIDVSSIIESFSFH